METEEAMKFLKCRRYLDKNKRGTKPILINPLMVTQLEAGDSPGEICVWMSGAYGPTHIAGDMKMLTYQIESAQKRVK